MNARSREAWTPFDSIGEDDAQLDRDFERAVEAIEDDEDELAEVRERVEESADGKLNVLLTAACNERRAAQIGIELFHAAQREIERAADWKLDQWREERALTRAGL